MYVAFAITVSFCNVVLTTILNTVVGRFDSTDSWIQSWISRCADAQLQRPVQAFSAYILDLVTVMVDRPEPA